MAIAGVPKRVSEFMGGVENRSNPYPSFVKTLRVICSIRGSRSARPCAQSVDPDVRTVAPASFVYVPSTAWPCRILSIAARSRVPKMREAMYCSSLGSSGFGGRGDVSCVKCCVGHVPRISNVDGVRSSPVGYGRPSRYVNAQPSHS